MESNLINNIEDTIIKCYSECPRTQNLHNDYSDYSVEECKDDIMMKLNSYVDYDFYEVKEKNVIVGYFAFESGVDYKYLITFFVRPKFRQKETLINYWNQVKKVVNYQDFMTGIFKSNKPARNFLIRNNGRIKYIKDKAMYFIMKGDKVCL